MDATRALMTAHRRNGLISMASMACARECRARLQKQPLPPRRSTVLSLRAHTCWQAVAPWAEQWPRAAFRKAQQARATPIKADPTWAQQQPRAVFRLECIHRNAEAMRCGGMFRRTSAT